MAVVSGGVLECRLFSEKTTLCCGRNFLFTKDGRGSFFRISVRECSHSNNNYCSVHSDSENAGEKLTRIREDVILLSHIEKRTTMSWWLPLFGWSLADQDRWEEDGINESKTKGKAMDKSSDDDHGKEMGEAQLPKSSKLLRGRFTTEKAKLLRKNLRETSTFHDTMYHSAIAAHLASQDNN